MEDDDFSYTRELTRLNVANALRAGAGEGQLCWSAKQVRVFFLHPFAVHNLNKHVIAAASADAARLWIAFPDNARQTMLDEDKARQATMDELKHEVTYYVASINDGAFDDSKFTDLDVAGRFPVNPNHSWLKNFTDNATGIGFVGPPRPQRGGSSMNNVASMLVLLAVTLTASVAGSLR